MSEKYPPVSFYFQLSFLGVIEKEEASFKEVSGITREMGMDEITEGGVNAFRYRVPTGAKHSNLVFKRGLVPKNSPVAKWCTDTLNDGLEETTETKNIIVTLLNKKGVPLKSWLFSDAWPVKWTMSDFNSMKNEIAIETLEFAYSSFIAV